ncbi:PfkB family carbohydrate kinase [Macrococcus armenti]|uniref:PfkB family carbohydrate kinase n=1 Tax=Macrococcus armenti TaxID=2875764 RepID=UPI001CCF8583|nr:PfkB family carbohydrate kinase [Macrococcus armenti]UBH15777.1 PfkB family carbohydrate kinase [Macrococcus armenti]UBH18136.1 PfkB family carbohydrate kinase [Macrococcus armenti]UBH20403.1 PfkB family carbohydrate kinase [Macrococcus armenti]
MDKCLIIGSTVCDVVINVDKLPTTAGDVHISSQAMSLGGCAYNVVSVLHHLGIPYTFISPVGTGMYGEFVARELYKKGIQTKVRVEDENGCCYCFVEHHGERTFMSHHGVEYTFNPEWLHGLNLDDYKYVYICGLEVEERDGDKLIDTLTHIDATIIFAPGPRGNLIPRERLERVYQLSPIVHLNEQEIMEQTGCYAVEAALEVIYRKTRNKIVVTQGEHGAIIYDGVVTHVPGETVAVKDTIGAGDSHAGAFISSLAKGMDDKSALTFANKVAGEVVQVSGVGLSDEVWDKIRF